MDGSRPRLQEAAPPPVQAWRRRLPVHRLVSPTRAAVHPLAVVRALLVGALVCLFTVSCAENHFDGRIFRHDDVAFRVGPIPAAWRQVEINDSALAFRDDREGATIAINGRCGKDADDVPLRALTQHLFLQFTDREVLSESLVQLDGREALVTELNAKLDGVAKNFVVVVLKKDNCVYDLMRIAGRAAADASEFETFYQGFSTVE